MLGCILIGMLAAFGAVCAGWLIYGMLLPRSQGTVLILDDTDSSTLRRCIWLQETGLMDSQLAVMPEYFSEKELAWLKCQGIKVWDASFLRCVLE